MKKLGIILLLITTGCCLQASLRTKELLCSSVVYPLNRALFDAGNSNNCIDISGHQSRRYSLFARKLYALGIYPDVFKAEVYPFEVFMDFSPKFFTDETSIALELSLEVLQRYGTFVAVDAPKDANSHIYLYGTLQVPLDAVLRIFIFRGGHWHSLAPQVKGDFDVTGLKESDYYNAGWSEFVFDFRPWKLVTYVAFDEEKEAIEFER